MAEKEPERFKPNKSGVPKGIDPLLVVKGVPFVLLSPRIVFNDHLVKEIQHSSRRLINQTIPGIIQFL